MASSQPAGFPVDHTAASFALADPDMDWTRAFIRDGKAAESEQHPTSFNALLGLQGDASRQFLLDQAALLQQPGVSSLQYADSRPSMTPFCSQQQQLPGGGFFISSSSGIFGSSPGPPPEHIKSNTGPAAVQVHQDACSSSATKRNGAGAGSPVASKKPRIDTPSPLPTFKVRKEKLGDRITALQQLVSPFGKTDTASVLHEAIGYIKFLHDQVASLSSPYLSSCGRALQDQHQLQGSIKVDGKAKEDLRSRGLCLVPVASTYTVANEAAPEFWNPTFGVGGTFR